MFPLGQASTIAELTADPYSLLARLRATEPVSWIPELDGWLVTRHDIAVRVMRDAGTFTVHDPRFSTAQVVGPSMLSLDGAEHTRHRTPFAGYFRPAEVVDDISAGRQPGPAAEAAVGELRGSVESATQGRSALLTAAAAALDLPEVVSNAAVLMFGGIETTEDMIANAVAHLLGNRDQFALVERDRSLLPAVVEESLRLEPAAAAVDRYAVQDVRLGGATIRRGDLVRVSLTAANRDPAVFADPDSYDVRRTNLRQHLAFAHGPHFCVAADLARLQARVAVGTVLDRLPGLALNSPAVPRGPVFRKPPAVDVRWRVDAGDVR